MRTQILTYSMYRDRVPSTYVYTITKPSTVPLQYRHAPTTQPQHKPTNSMASTNTRTHTGYSAPTFNTRRPIPIILNPL